MARYEKKQKSFEASSIAENQQQIDVGQENGGNMGHIAVDEAIVTAEIIINSQVQENFESSHPCLQGVPKKNYWNHQ